MIDEAEVTVDAFLDGRVRLRQPASGYRAGMDAVFLAASLDPDNGLSMAEAGCGAGAALLCAGARLEGARLTGFEREAHLAAMLEASAVDNGFGDRVCGEVHDIRERPRELENVFDQSFSNPPFFDPRAIRAPAEGKAGAYLAEAPLKAWVLFLHHVTRPGGRITLIHRAAALAELMELLNPRAGEIEVLPIRPAPGLPAKRVLVRARKGLRRGDVRLHDGLALHETPGGAATPRATAVLAGEALEWR